MTAEDIERVRKTAQLLLDIVGNSDRDQELDDTTNNIGLLNMALVATELGNIGAGTADILYASAFLLELLVATIGNDADERRQTLDALRHVIDRDLT